MAEKDQTLLPAQKNMENPRHIRLGEFRRSPYGQRFVNLVQLRTRATALRMHQWRVPGACGTLCCKRGMLEPLRHCTQSQSR